MEEDADGIPFVSRQSENNGVVGYVKEDPMVRPNPANTISVACGGSVMSSFLQDIPYYSSFHVNYLTPKVKLTKKQMLFYCLCLRSNAYKYNYGRQANKTLENILIPNIDEIAEYVEEIDIPAMPTTERIKHDSISLEDRRWNWFYFKDVFTIKKGKRLTKSDTINGEIPFIGAIDSNNGYREYIDVIPIHSGNTISVNYNGSVGEAFYQPIPYWATDDCNILYNDRINVFTGLFICTIIKLEKYRFNYGRKWHKERMENSLIKLPIDNTGKPDWKFMEDFIKALPYSKNLENIT